MIGPASGARRWPKPGLTGGPQPTSVRARPRTEPFDGYLWQSRLECCPEAEIGDLITLAQNLLPLDDLATGPATSRGLGPSNAPDRALDLIVSHLDAYPGHRWVLIKTALRNRTIRARGQTKNEGTCTR